MPQPRLGETLQARHTPPVRVYNGCGPVVIHHVLVKSFPARTDTKRTLGIRSDPPRKPCPVARDHIRSTAPPTLRYHRPQEISQFNQTYYCS